MDGMSLQERIEESALEYGMVFQDDYSGRFMYGKRCLAVVGSRSSITPLIEKIKLSYQEKELGKVMGILANYQTDSLGKYDTVFYWQDLVKEVKNG
jgi:hypothetical protein